MPSLFTRLANLFPGFRASPTPQAARADLVAKTKARLEETPARPRPGTDERVPANYVGGIAGKVWFLPFRDSATHDTPEIRAAMRLMRRDGYVKAAWQPQILTVASEDWQIQPAEAGNSESEEQAEFCKRAIEDYMQGGMPQLVQAICAPFGADGFSLGEKVRAYAERGRLAGKLIVSAVKAKDPEQLRLVGDGFNNLTGVQALRSPDQREWPISDFIYSRYLTVFDEPLGESVFRAAYGPYWMRDTVRKLRIIHHEKKMAGFLVGTYQADDDKGPLEQCLRNARSATWAAVPEGTRIEAVALSTASEPDYRSFDESLRDEIVTSIAFATLQTIQGNIPDARGDSKVQKAMADLGPWLLMVIVSDAVNHQLIPDLIDYNFPYAAGGGYPKLTFGAVSNQELLDLLSVVQGAQQLGLSPSRKHYAKALSIQESDPNDPDDTLTQPGMEQGGGGMAPPPFGGDPFGGGMGAALPPDDPFAGGGEAQPFSELLWDAFRDPVEWTRQGNGTWKSSGGRVLSDEAYQRHRQRVGASARRRTQGQNTPAPQSVPEDLPNDYGAGRRKYFAKKTLPDGREVVVEEPAATGPESKPSFVGPPRPWLTDEEAYEDYRPLDPPTAPTTKKERKRHLKAAAQATKHYATVAVKFQARAIAAFQQAGAWTGQKAAQAAGWVGTQLKRFGWLERKLGLGRAIEKEAARKAARFKAIKEMAKSGNPVKTTLTGMKKTAELAEVRFRKIRRKHGRAAAWAAEALYITVGLMGRAKNLLLGTPVLGAILKPVSVFLGTLINPIIRAGADRLAGVIGGTKRTRNINAPGRVAQRLDRLAAKGKRPKKWDKVALAVLELDRAEAEGIPVAIPAEIAAVAKKARALRTKSGPGVLVAGPGGLPVKNRRFAEEPMGFVSDPAELVLDLRTAIEEDFGEEVPYSDAQLSIMLAASLAELVKLAAGGSAETFAEAYESFGWQAGRTRANTLKAVGTAEHAGQTLYGQRAKEALAREGGASKRQQTPRNVSYNVTNPDGSTTAKKATGVSPERARAMAIAAKVAALEGGAGGPRPTDVKVKKQRSPKKVLAAIGAGVAAGDPRSVRQLQGLAQQAVDTPRAEMTPDDNAKMKSAAMTAISQSGISSEVGSGLFSRLFAGLSKGWEGLKSVAGWVSKLARPVARLAVKSLVLFARTAAKVGWWGVKTGFRAVRGVVTSDTVKPFLHWAGGIALAAAILAAPVAAVGAGVIPELLAMGLVPVAAGGAWWAMRRAGRKTTDAGLRNKGEGFITETKKFGERDHRFAESADFALAGPDGKRAEHLLSAAQAEGSRVFADACAKAVARLMATGDPLSAGTLFDDDELAAIQQALSCGIATADLLGRTRIRRRAEMAETFAEGTGPDPFHDFAEPVPPLAPDKAVAYFGKLVPAVGGSTVRYGPKLDRHAFTLAVAADQVILDKVKQAITRELETGADATQSVQDILDAAGVSHANPQYAEMVVRTNVLDALNQGAVDELAAPEMQEAFPAWRYEGILDDRTGDDHRPKIGKVFPSTASFAEVRGPRVWNCRCSLSPIHKFQMNGVHVEERW